MEDLTPLPHPNRPSPSRSRICPYACGVSSWRRLSHAGCLCPYAIFQILVEAVGYQGGEELYDLVVREIEKTMACGGLSVSVRLGELPPLLVADVVLGQKLGIAIAAHRREWIADLVDRARGQDCPRWLVFRCA